MKFMIWSDGDPSVGIPGSSAEVQFHGDVNDPEFKQYVVETLRDAFSDIFDDRLVHVMAEEDIETE
jgi:hypothetical protein